MTKLAEPDQIRGMDRRGLIREALESTASKPAPWFYEFLYPVPSAEAHIRRQALSEREALRAKLMAKLDEIRARYIAKGGKLVDQQELDAEIAELRGERGPET
jgi:hypothetical protein